MAASSYNIVAIVQAGRLQYEAIMLAASLALTNPGTRPRLILAEPQPGPLWPEDPRATEPERSLLAELGAEIVPFESHHFGAAYPYGNKIEALAALPRGIPFLFLDTDTLVTGPLEQLEFGFDRPAASMRREGTWPVPPLYGPGYGEIWKALYDRFSLDFDSSLDPGHPDEHWRRYLYFNAGWFFYRCPQDFGARFLDFALSIRDDPPDALASQSLDPWLDQVALPLVIHALGGGRPGGGLDGLDGSVTCHYRLLPLLYAREADHVVEVLEQATAPNRIKKILKAYQPARKMIYHGHGARARALFDRDALPPREQLIRNRLRQAKLWIR